MNKHTPGPWRTYIPENVAEWSQLQVFSSSETERGVCLVNSGNKVADAKLITAAPEMLVALKKLYEYLLGDPRHPVSDIAYLEQIIAKAEGRL